MINKILILINILEKMLGLNLECSIDGHVGGRITHICLLRDCNSFSRQMCDKCTKEHKHIQNNYVEIEKFTEHYKDLKLP